MGPLNDRFQHGLGGWIEPEDAKRFLRPDESAGSAPAKAPRVAEPLGFCQIRLLGRDLRGGVLSVAPHHEKDQQNNEQNSARHGRGREHELPGGIRAYRASSALDPRPAGPRPATGRVARC